ncbi:hypothetical protein [Amycolatopsis sp. TNS106]|uniref:hypothetical protein n=2 Tax=Amycolatopsis TaxID=1813 RepID=UPI001C5A0134|nr:hypothetical protein [Amycolatopsis sp. TNS106]QXV61133.1 hypothetical protein CVV72_31830 [Amycolatopsis sp. TNS106]
MQVISALIGVLVGGAISFTVQRLESQRATRVSRTHRLYETWQSAESLVHRVKAVHVLRDNMDSPDPVGFISLMSDESSLAADDQFALTRILHFFEECGTLLEVKAIDQKLYKKLFERYVVYWVDGYLQPLHEVSSRTESEIETGWFPHVARLRSAMDAPRGFPGTGELDQAADPAA